MPEASARQAPVLSPVSGSGSRTPGSDNSATRTCNTMAMDDQLRTAATQTLPATRTQEEKNHA